MTGESGFELRAEWLVLRFLLGLCYQNALKHNVLSSPPPLLVAVVSTEEAFLTTVRETTKYFSFHFPSPILWDSFVFESLCCLLMVFLMLISLLANMISVTSRLWGKLLWFKRAASGSVLPALMGASLFVCLLASHYKQE